MAAQSIFGSDFRLLKQRGQWLQLDAQTRGFATVHPSYLLWLPDEAAREKGFEDFVRDLALMRGVADGKTQTDGQ